jgi:hypothetical protein
LVERLPRESCTVQTSAGDKARWGDVEHLIADVVDAVQMNSWLFAAANSKKNPKLPKPLRRPGVDVVDSGHIGGKGHTVEEMRRMLDGWSNPESVGLTAGTVSKAVK